ncbi:hypothetical protein L596_019816 [Steinernema carpocapsae]|uniref:Uncharacterized protein n=1 Tax=Steinernema carpocapsae TaxID=34508 RepID=A0A4U5MRQ7_STECR|nr:hypothetical protein L596_019816 [Steinernema carpocapsae]
MGVPNGFLNRSKVERHIRHYQKHLKNFDPKGNCRLEALAREINLIRNRMIVEESGDRINYLSHLQNFEQSSMAMSAFTTRLAEQLWLSYPYSTRELVNIVKHVQMFPDDPLVNVVKNVFDFDTFSADAMEQIGVIFQKHGIPLGVKRPSDTFLSVKHAIPKMTSIGSWGLKNNVVPEQVEVETYPARISVRMSGLKKYFGSWFQSSTNVFAPNMDLETRHMRSTFFSEQVRVTVVVDRGMVSGLEVGALVVFIWSFRVNGLVGLAP